MTACPAWPQLRRPLVAILRGLGPADAEAVADALVEEGFEAIEVPLNSPDPFVSIERMARRHGEATLIGAGTVLTPEAVDKLADTGARLMVTPNVDAAVIRRAAERGLIAMPGVLTPSEALAALAAGASALKFFPASVLGAGGIAAIRAILPTGTTIGAVGGISEKDFSAYMASGIETFGLGSSLYRPGDSAQAVREKARLAVAAFDAAKAAR
ncbi:2-dehydro-3-deoxy-6-phosphogalactonate aldolase [Aureimonas mangrovi]|uniref:2-dehydro-3-deoxy-6-phosphogalactonate aldolase n=1 Tax=Aureimonas mangrovi TaxID=2758041 RepID=UPI00163DC76B|nr:2-dehydro-3-deoxy-6-phosphogalactonate aldolase [Aureimonas mangrovi]